MSAIKPDLDKADSASDFAPSGSTTKKITKATAKKHKKPSEQTAIQASGTKFKRANERRTVVGKAVIRKETTKKQAKGGRSHPIADGKQKDMTHLLDSYRMMLCMLATGVQELLPSQAECGTSLFRNTAHNNSIGAPQKAKPKTSSERKKTDVASAVLNCNEKVSNRPQKKPSMTRKEIRTIKDASNSDETASEQRLLLTLFTLNSSQRAMYIKKRGIDLGLFDPNPSANNNKVLINQRVQHLTTALSAEAKQYISTSGTRNEENGDKKVKKTLSTLSFEQQANRLLKSGRRHAVVKHELDFKPTEIGNSVSHLVKTNAGYLVEGTLRINAHNNEQSFVGDSSRKKDKESIFMNSILLRQCAMDGDLVRVFVKKQPVKASKTTKSKGSKEPARKQNLGFVVEILEKHHNRQCIGTFVPASAPKENLRGFIPQDPRIPPVHVFNQYCIVAPNEMDAPATQEEEIRLYLVEIIEWQRDVPIGRIVRSLSRCDALRMKNKALLDEHDLDVTPYGEDILEKLPAVPFIIPEEEVSRREDLRGECIFTIDSATAFNLDDALSCKVLPNGNFEIGVHIADVTYFLRERSDLDEIAKLRATSIYMVDAVYHMLPQQLCNTCSLLPGEDKLAFSVIWEMLPDATVVSTRFARSVINSCAKLSYEHAQMMIENPEGQGLDSDQFPEILHGNTVGAVRQIVDQLYSIAEKLRQRRMDDGWLGINQQKLTFWFDTAAGCPIEYSTDTVRRSKMMVEELMQLANSAVAQAIHAAFPSTSVLRSQTPTSVKTMENLAQTLAKNGHPFSFATPNDIHESMAAIVAGAEHPDAARIVLNVMLSKLQHYYGSPSKMYTHFTSPIRRYVDCLVHRVLAAMIKTDDEPQRTADEVKELVEMCRRKYYAAKVAGDASLLVHYRNWLETVKQHETVAAVLEYGPKHIKVILIHSGIVVNILTKNIAPFARVRFNRTKPDEGIRWIPNNARALTLKLFQMVRVTIMVVHGAITVCSISNLQKSIARD